MDSEVTEYDRGASARASPEGVYISGLSLDGAIWDKSGACVAELNRVHCEMPILFVTAVTKQRRNPAIWGPSGGFSCPVYSTCRRTDKYIIFMVNLPSQQKPDHRMRGASLLCFTSGTS